MRSIIKYFKKNKKYEPDDILKITSKIKYDDFTNFKKYLIKSPENMLKIKEGICYDLVELERYLFNKINYECKTFFAYQKLPINDQTHTFLVYKEDNKYHWFESSWESYRGVHGRPFNSYESACKYVSKQLKESSKWKNVNIVEYNKFNYKNMNILQFAEYIIKNFK